MRRGPPCSSCANTKIASTFSRTVHTCGPRRICEATRNIIQRIQWEERQQSVIADGKFGLENDPAEVMSSQCMQICRHRCWCPTASIIQDVETHPKVLSHRNYTYTIWSCFPYGPSSSVRKRAISTVQEPAWFECYSDIVLSTHLPRESTTRIRGIFVIFAWIDISGTTHVAAPGKVIYRSWYRRTKSPSVDYVSTVRYGARHISPPQNASDHQDKHYTTDDNLAGSQSVLPSFVQIINLFWTFEQAGLFNVIVDSDNIDFSSVVRATAIVDSQTVETLRRKLYKWPRNRSLSRMFMSMSHNTGWEWFYGSSARYYPRQEMMYLLRSLSLERLTF